MTKRIACLFVPLLFLCFEGCGTVSKPFVKINERITYNFYPTHYLPEAILAESDDERVLKYIDGLVANQQLNEAVYFLNQHLLLSPNSPLKEYLRFKKVKIQFLQNFLFEYHKGKYKDKGDFFPRTYLKYEGICESLNKYLTQEGFDTSPEYEKQTFERTGYPSERDTRYLMALIKATRVQLDSCNLEHLEPRYQLPKDSMMNFLNEFEEELVWLRIWKIIQDTAWDSAVAYADTMRMAYPKLSEKFDSLKYQIARRPILPTKSPKIALVGSTLMPGLGQAYAGEHGSALSWFLGHALHPRLAIFLLNGANPKDDRAEVLLGGVLSITSLITYIANIKDAGEKTSTFNDYQKGKELRLFVEGLDDPPPGSRPVSSQE